MIRARTQYILTLILPTTASRFFRNGGRKGGNERGSSALGGVASARICRGQYAQGVPRKVEHVD